MHGGYVHVHMCMCVPMLMRACGSQKTTLNMAPQELSTLLWERVSLTWIRGSIIKRG